MLAADKLQLQSALKQQATALKEKEFQLHHSNLMTVGTQAAVLAGLDITMFIEFSPEPDENWHPDYRHIATYIKILYYAVIVAAFCANMIVVSHTTALSVLGAGMALRGPDGSMMTATDGLYEERRSVFITFGIGLACTVGSVLLSVWLMLPAASASVCFVVALLTCRKIYTNYVRVTRRFGFNEADTVDFRDIMEGTAVASLNTHGRGSPWRRQYSDPPNSGPARLGKKGYRKSISSSAIPHDESLDEWSDHHDLEMQQSLLMPTSSRDNDDVKLRRKTNRLPSLDSPTTAASKKIITI